MYERISEDDKPNAFGLTRADFERIPIEVWPEHWPAYVLFCDLQTQWRTGAAGCTGLDYNVLDRRLDRLQQRQGLSDDERDALEDDIRTMEYEALATMHEKIE
ncbi:hypothetical protein GJ698_22160 [Pseudoduganella sp. FT26W]|uniref:DUF1799 domain-containing protein n=1 Tax=Duganella aquatilis TaxID=2666082 RepID=A0A844DFC8_9BURK|nr:DUF1799 domain-containing protein [Duganella aquatilis]MRW86779.1 hypothetical protein [Duganella aquatilis]